MTESEDVLEERVDPITFFSPEIHTAVSGMMYLGAHTREVNFVGHRFVLETIRPHLKYAIGQAMQPYRDTLTEPQVWAAMHVGLALTSIDGKTDFAPALGDNEVEFARGRFNFVTNESGWYQPTIEYLFAEYTILEQEVAQAIVELQNLALAGKPISLVSPGFSTEPESSTEEMFELDPQFLESFSSNS